MTSAKPVSAAARTKVTIGNHSPGKPELARRVQPVA
jgi:hypothetical protein